jgi:hypothetical protein
VASDLRSELERAATRFPPPSVDIDDVRSRAERRAVGRRATALLVAALIAVGGVGVAFSAFRGADEQPVAPPSADCVPQTEGLTAWWPGDGSGDDVIGGHDARLIGDTRFGEGLVGEGFVLDGDGDWVEVPHPGLDVGNRDFTIDLWVRFRSTEGEQVLVEKWVQTPSRRTNRGWILQKMTNDVILFATGRSGGASTEPLELSEHRWIHIAARRRGEQASILVDGQLMTTERLRIPDWPLDSVAWLKFGHRGTTWDTPDSTDERGFFFSGDIDEVRLVVGRALTDAEIMAIYEAGPAGTCASPS